eukprot:1175433-Prorocentrum_minimum.AAC.2
MTVAGTNHRRGERICGCSSGAELRAHSPLPAHEDDPEIAVFIFGTFQARASAKKLGGELNSPVVEWLIKGLMAVWSPTRKLDTDMWYSHIFGGRVEFSGGGVAY